MLNVRVRESGILTFVSLDLRFPMLEQGDCFYHVLVPPYFLIYLALSHLGFANGLNQRYAEISCKAFCDDQQILLACVRENRREREKFETVSGWSAVCKKFHLGANSLMLDFG